MDKALCYPIRHWGVKPRPDEPQVYLEVGVFAEAILWGRQAPAQEYGLMLGNQAVEPARVVIGERFAGEGQAADIADLEPVGAIFWRHDGSTALVREHAIIMREHGNPALALVLDTSRRGWSLYLFCNENYQKLTSVSIYQKYGTQAGLDKTLMLLGQIPWSETMVKPEQPPALDDGYQLTKIVHTTRKAFLWGGLAGLFLGAALALIIFALWGGWQKPAEIDRWGFLSGNRTLEEGSVTSNLSEQARTKARLALERALAGNPDEILEFCSDVVSRAQCHQALDKLRITPQYSLSYNPQGVQISTTLPGLPAYLFIIDAVDNGFRITGVQELMPPIELGIKTVPKNKDNEKEDEDGETKDAAKTAENAKANVDQTQTEEGKLVAP